MSQQKLITKKPSASRTILLFLADAIFFGVKFYVLLLLVFAPFLLAQYVFKTFFPSAIVFLNSRRAAPLAPYGVVACFFYFWFATTFIIGEMSGWRKLARRFRAPHKFAEGQLFRWRNGGFGVVSYNHVLNIRLAPAGLYIACIFPFRMFHPALLIPWPEVKAVTSRQILWNKMLQLTIGAPKIATISLADNDLLSALSLAGALEALEARDIYP